MIQRMADRVTTKDALLAVEERGDRLYGALLAAHASGVDVVRAGSIARGQDLGADARALVDLLAGPGARPRAAIFLAEQATAVCLRVPPTAGLSAERMASLVRWELEPFLAQGAASAQPGEDGPLACGWAERATTGDAPLFACGLAAGARGAMVGAFRAAGLRLDAIYPALGCAAGLAGTSGDVVLLELFERGARIGCTRLEGGVVSRFSVVRCDATDPDAVADACLALAEGGQLALAGPIPEDVLARLGAHVRVGEGAIDPLGEPVSASLLGAAHHALDLPGGERVPAVAARDPRPALWSRPAVRQAALAGVAALALVLIDVTLGARVASARAEVATLEAITAQARADAEAVTALKRRGRELTAEHEALSARAASAAQAGASADVARALLEAVAGATPDDLAVDALHAGAGEVRVQGFALSALAVQRFVRDLGVALEPTGHAPRGHVVHRRPGRLDVEGYWFEARFATAAARLGVEAGR